MKQASPLTITLAQINPTVGDISGNLAQIRHAILESTDADIIVFPELAVCGYPPQDLLSHHSLLDACEATILEVRQLSAQMPHLLIVVGSITGIDEKAKAGKGLYNSAVCIAEGQEKCRYHKQLLPSYDIFDECRFFRTGPGPVTTLWKGHQIGFTICEDLWGATSNDWGNPLYETEVAAQYRNLPIDMIINLSASPFEYAKWERRLKTIQKITAELKVPMVYVNQIGANDGVIFDGQSMVLNAEGNVVHRAPAFETASPQVDLLHLGPPVSDQPIPAIEAIHDALVLGIRDYVRKSGFSKGVVGLSGGIDSAVVAALAVQAVGKENVIGITMPSRYSSAGSATDAQELAANLGIQIHQIPIQDIVSATEHSLSSLFKDTQTGLAEENIQSRSRGLLLMALSNKFNWLLLNTGNKSELAVGYCTLYGDMNGALSALGDIYKTQVYELAHYINRSTLIIPTATIEKPPSAELRPDQKDQDTLPDYALLDEIIRLYVEERYSAEEIAATGIDPETVNWVCRTTSRNEYKRFQSPPILKVSQKAFGIGRRYPIAAKYPGSSM